MDLNIPYFVYCEKTSWYLLEQPANILSNLAFFGAAATIWMNDRGRGTSLSLMAAMLVVCGMTGMMWHGTELRIALGLDVAAQLAFGAVLVMVLANQILGWIPLNSIMAAVIFLLLVLLGRDMGLPFLLQNGGAFLPMMIYLVVLAFVKIQSGNARPAKYLLSAAYVLFIGLILRSLDWVLCEEFPLGTHWAWHVAVALSACLAIEAVHKNQEDQRVSA